MILTKLICNKKNTKDNGFDNSAVMLNVPDPVIDNIISINYYYYYYYYLKRCFTTSAEACMIFKWCDNSNGGCSCFG